MKENKVYIMKDKVVQVTNHVFNIEALPSNQIDLFDDGMDHQEELSSATQVMIGPNSSGKKRATKGLRCRLSWIS
ncbi:hypothetical protein CCR75_005171 [Bremia lactucae]|uniref:Uncharacterized protein n=1 Tax=Bremia lactucae TaxID=4779 RepID=A0A976FKU0_BRELC|nr:hypothetical protein CCR75_005171 [Bremia lactucae]